MRKISLLILVLLVGCSDTKTTIDTKKFDQYLIDTCDGQLHKSTLDLYLGDETDTHRIETLVAYKMLWACPKCVNNLSPTIKKELKRHEISLR